MDVALDTALAAWPVISWPPSPTSSTAKSTSWSQISRRLPTLQIGGSSFFGAGAGAAVSLGFLASCSVPFSSEPRFISAAWYAARSSAAGTGRLVLLSAKALWCAAAGVCDSGSERCSERFVPARQACEPRADGGDVVSWSAKLGDPWILMRRSARFDPSRTRRRRLPSAADACKIFALALTY